MRLLRDRELFCQLSSGSSLPRQEQLGGLIMHKFATPCPHRMW
jgi:hypothetical protein